MKIREKWLDRTLNSKREFIIYVVILFWVYLGVLGIWFDVDLADVSVYFLSLTGFIMSYIFGESVRKSKDTSLFLRGKTSKRELITYLIMFFWVGIGTFTIVFGGDIISAATYFGSLTPFVGAYIIGETYKEEPEDDVESPSDSE
jgi:predicted neutral ceramidase superfamily lipid hydrolase